MATIGFLHTAEVHRATFAALVEALAPGTELVQVVDDSLLADARARGGVDEDLRGRILARLREAGRGVRVVVCTCSTIGGAAEGLAGAADLPVLRVDRPMAERAVASGRRIGVAAAVASTLGPTTELLNRVAGERGLDVDLSEIGCYDAWPHFERGDTDAYLDAVAATIDGSPQPVDVVVLAQASMAGAVGRCRTTVPILSSPRLAVEAALGVAGL